MALMPSGLRRPLSPSLSVSGRDGSGQRGIDASRGLPRSPGAVGAWRDPGDRAAGGHLAQPARRQGIGHRAAAGSRRRRSGSVPRRWSPSSHAWAAAASASPVGGRRCRKARCSWAKATAASIVALPRRGRQRRGRREAQQVEAERGDAIEGGQAGLQGTGERCHGGAVWPGSRWRRLTVLNDCQASSGGSPVGVGVASVGYEAFAWRRLDWRPPVPMPRSPRQTA